MKKLVIAGAGGCAREILWLIKENEKIAPQWEFLGFAGPQGELTDDFVLNFPEPLCVIVGVNDPALRRAIVEKYEQNKLVEFPAVASLRARIGDGIELARGCVVGEGSVITTDVTLGEFVNINIDCKIHHDCVVGSYVSMAPSVNLSGNVKVGEGTSLGVGATVIQNINIGRGCVIGAGAVVIKDVANGVTAVGNPARDTRLKKEE